MKIGIDARLLERRMTGIGRTLAGILEFILEMDRENEYFLFSFGNLEDYKKRGFKVIPTGEQKLIPSKIYSPIWLNFILPRYLRRHNIDLFFSPSGLIPKTDLKCKTVILVCDVFHKVNQGYHPFIYRKYLDFFLTPSIKRSDLILTISQSSKKDIIDFYKVPGEKVKIIYLAAEKAFQPRSLSPEQKERLKKKYDLPSEFILYVGVLEKRKNIEGIIKIADLIKDKTEARILLFGKLGHQGEKYLKEIKKRENIQYRGFIEAKDLPLVYNLAKIFLFPSFYEGFGLPVLEACQSGTAVVTSNTSSLPEVIGEKGIMHNPEDHKSFAEDIVRLLGDRNFYDNIKRQGLERAESFTWRKAAQEIIILFNLVYGAKK